MMHLGENLSKDTKFFINPAEFMQGHCFIQGITGSGKTTLIMRLIEQMKNDYAYKETPIIILDALNEFLELPDKFKDFRLISNKRYSEILSPEFAYRLGLRARKDGLSLVIKMKDIGKPEQQEAYVAEFIRGLRDIQPEEYQPLWLIIDEAHRYVGTKAKRGESKSRIPLVDATAEARKEGMSITLATQFSAKVDSDARSNCANIIAGKTVDPYHKSAIARLLGDSKLESKLQFLVKGDFYVFGEALSPTSITKIHVQVPFEEPLDIAKNERGICVVCGNTGSGKGKDGKIYCSPDCEAKTEKISIDEAIKTSVMAKTDQSLLETLQKTIARQNERIIELEKNELTSEKEKALKEIWVNEGIDLAQKHWKNKSFKERLFD